MNDSVDLRRLLESWPYDPEDDARLVLGDDGRRLMQVRTPVGIEQYEMDGRPDGLRPHGAESFLEYHHARLEQARSLGQEESFTLAPAECAELFHESTLYYFRYVRLFQLRDWQRTLRDTARNLRVFDFLKRYADREEDQRFLEKWRPYVLRVNSTASAMLALDKKDFVDALRIVSKAIETLEALEDVEDETFTFERERSLMALKELGAQIGRERPVTRVENLERQLRRAIELQEFERAAELRDKIKAAKSNNE